MNCSLSPARATVAFAGRLTAQKALSRAVEAVAGSDGVRLVIAGEGPEHARLAARAVAVGPEHLQLVESLHVERERPLRPVDLPAEGVLAAGGPPGGLDRADCAAVELDDRLDRVVDLAALHEDARRSRDRRDLADEVAGAQAKLDQILKMAESGRTFSPAELLAFQAHAYRASQELDLAGKVVEKATSGVKQTLNTQV